MLATPTIALVEQEGKTFDDDNQLIEDTLGLLWAQYPKNTDLRHVYVKVLVLNKLYATRVNDNHVETLARHIHELALHAKLDQLLGTGAFEAVFLIARCAGIKEYLSFASKFCSWHNQGAYPIFDRNVRECLWAYQERDRFADFKKDDLFYYLKYVDKITTFRSHYGLDSLNFKELDKFMFLVGDRIVKAPDFRENQPPVIQNP